MTSNWYPTHAHVHTATNILFYMYVFISARNCHFNVPQTIIRLIAMPFAANVVNSASVNISCHLLRKKKTNKTLLQTCERKRFPSAKAPMTN